MWIIWLYGSIAVLIISLAGLSVIILLPKLQNDHQSNLSQIFVGLAVGTLSADALLHLLPHAFSSQLNHDHPDNETLLKHQEYQTESNGHSHANSVWYGLLALVGIIGFLFFERLTIIFNDLFNQPDQTIDEPTAAKCSTTSAEFLPPDLQSLNNHHHQHEMKELQETIDELVVVSNNTSIAVLCHELPHELGDFTIIIRSGMPLRNAVYWNIVASITCWFGMCLGIFLGSMKDAWLSALIGGTFLYISLVDMVPELDSCPHLPSKSRAIKLTVQMIGISIGIAIMLLIS
ncbi:zinc transporter-like protein, partial [Euroglyphus maynei]